MKTAPLVHLQSADNLLKYVNAHRFESDVEDSSQQRELVFYSQLITDIITWFTDVISEQNTGAVWKFIVALNEVRYIAQITYNYNSNNNKYVHLCCRVEF